MTNDELLKSLRLIHRHFITFNDDMKALFINSVLNDIDSIIELTFKLLFFIVVVLGRWIGDFPLPDSFPCMNFLSPRSAFLMTAQNSLFKNQY
jgi:hypothetical protein